MVTLGVEDVEDLHKIVPVMDNQHGKIPNRRGTE